MDGSMLILKNAYVIDSAQGIDGVTDVAIADGKIAWVGAGVAADGAQVMDLAGRYLSPGWIDIHVHAYGTLGFGDPDRIGIYQGVTSFIDAGGTGINTLDECMALMDGVKTGLYAGPLIFPFGIVGLDYLEQQVDFESIEQTGVQPWLDWMASHPGLLRFLKATCYSPIGMPPIDIAKKYARRLGLPLYLHIGENYDWPDLESPFEHAFGVLEAGDIVTHCYHGANDRVLDRQGVLRPCVKSAMERGVLFDIGFGSYGFSWETAEKALAQGLRPHFISSDLQQFNVLHPVFSLANVMSICMALGLPLQEVIAAVTATPAGKLKLGDRAGSLRPGLPADITVFSLEAGRFELADGFKRKRTIETRFCPVMAFKDGVRFDSDLLLAQDERNWFMQVMEDEVPAAATQLSPPQLIFIEAFAQALQAHRWEVTPPLQLSLPDATRLQDCFNAVRRESGLPLKDALNAVYDCFLDSRFPMQIGLFMVRLDRGFALSRLQEVASRCAAIAA
jgi:dihydroorotase